MQDQILPLFRDVLLICEEQELLGGTFFALDGCKLPSNASKEWSGLISDLKNKQAKLEQKVQRLLKEQIEVDHNQGVDPAEQSKRERQIKKLQHQADRIERWLNGNGPRTGGSGREVQSNIRASPHQFILSHAGDCGFVFERQFTDKPVNGFLNCFGRS